MENSFKNTFGFQIRFKDLAALIFIFAIIALLLMFSEIALGQNKFYATPNRGVESGKANVQIKTLNEITVQNTEAVQALQNTLDTSLTTVIDKVKALQGSMEASLTSVSDCGNLGMMGGPEHAIANGQDCLPSLVIDNTGETVFSEPTQHEKAIILGDNPTCDANNEGMLRYISTQKSVMLCTGTAWIELGAAPDASGVYTPVTDANINQSYTSNSITLSGFFGLRTATATNGAIIVVNGVSQGASANVEAGDSVALRMTSSTTFNTAKSTTLSLSSYSQTWTITTKPQDTTPNAFSIANLTNQALSTLVQSAPVTVSGFDGPLTVSISGAGSPQLQVAGGAWVTSGSINPGQSLRLRLTTSSNYSTSTNATLVLGTVSVAWSATTQAGLCANIGQSLQGGKCATTGPNALIAASTDAPGSYMWGNHEAGSGSTWNGQNNTAILAAKPSPGAHPAALACANLTLSGFDDWYLPARDELFQLYQAKVLIGGFAAAYYWSSTESGVHTAYLHRFAGGMPESYFKNYDSRVRCVRRAN